jgi:hypothetical protein
MAQRPKVKLKSKGPKNTDKKQSERFIEAARRMQPEDEEKFEKTFRTIVPIKSKGQGP